MTIAQVTAESLIGPGAQVTAAGIWFFFAKWLMAIHREDMATLILKMNAFERALFLNSQATLMMALAQEEASAVMRDKLKLCLKELEESEASRLKTNDEKRGK